MDNLLKNLEDYGADIAGAMGRFLDDMDLYKNCFSAVLIDETFFKLGEAIKAMNYENAFDYAHTLKGITGNMGLTPLYQIFCTMLEDLRKNNYSALQRYYRQITDELSKLKTIQQENLM